MRRLLITATVTALLAAGGCADDAEDAAGPGPTGSTSATPSSSNAPDRIKVLAVTDVYADIVRSIGGDRVEVTSIIGGAAADPHSYEATARDQLAVSDADLVIANGGHYDDFLTRLLDAADGEREVLTAVTEAQREDEQDPAQSFPTPHEHGDAGNEHVWYDLQAMSVLATRIGDALTGLDPGSRGAFQANAAQFRSSLDSLMGRQREINDAFGSTPIAVTEPVPLFLLDDSGLIDQTPPEFSEAIEEGSDVPARTLQETLALFTDGEVGLLVYNAQTTGPQTEQVKKAAEDNEIAVVGVTETLPPGQDYLGWMRANLDAIYTALEGTEAPDDEMPGPEGTPTP